MTKTTQQEVKYLTFEYPNGNRIKVKMDTVAQSYADHMAQLLLIEKGGLKWQKEYVHCFNDAEEALSWIIEIGWEGTKELGIAPGSSTIKAAKPGYYKAQHKMIKLI